ncbi:hypothetical protein CDAR_113541 [Caerostris darwini]|uniref:Uncharacterized protein n=1 Tax=Caerostris darwini TaxID=1538125 RepID=A0AAV4UE84_9ARAC|nr:hypothetical protein CDAR_113541 [Caerostris darwini]
MSKLGNVSVIIEIWMHIKALANELKYYKEKIEARRYFKINSECHSVLTAAEIFLAQMKIEFEKEQSSNTLNESSQAFKPFKYIILLYKNKSAKKSLKHVCRLGKLFENRRDVNKLAPITEEEYDVIRRITEIGERVAE